MSDYTPSQARAIRDAMTRPLVAMEMQRALDAWVADRECGRDALGSQTKLDNLLRDNVKWLVGLAIEDVRRRT